MFGFPPVLRRLAPNSPNSHSPCFGVPPLPLPDLCIGDWKGDGAGECVGVYDDLKAESKPELATPGWPRPDGGRLPFNPFWFLAAISARPRCDTDRRAAAAAC